ncbi:Signal transduction response regulator, receiver domain [Dillenia turbinata]|uniref:histidine kinase n=1 Tax=Dillenia turbinata TaxID=194707 RepID=A0AAN8Z7H3_9MAGN
MVCEMEDHDIEVEEGDNEVLSSMWPEDIVNEAGKKFNIEKPKANQDMLEEVNILRGKSRADFKRLLDLINYSEKGSSQLAFLVKSWEYKQANAVRLLKEELDTLSKQRQEVELKKLEIIEEHRFEEERYAGDKRSISILDDVYDFWQGIPRRRKDVIVQNKNLEVEAEYDTVLYWKQRAMHLQKLLEASMQREQMLKEKLQESISNLKGQSSPVEELSQILKRADNFLHFILQNAPVVIGNQDQELRYRFIYNHFPTLHEEDIIGKTDVEIFSGAGVDEIQAFKREVLERGFPGKREFTFDTELFGSKTFLIYVEPVFSKAGETIGVNYMGMEVTDQVKKREKMAKLREEIAVQKAKETELNKTIHITEETMRAKQMLATMSHEIRSPLTGVVSMAEILSTTTLDPDQRQLLDVMLSSGDLVLQLINDILDLSKVESGVMKLEATKFRPREVVKHVLQTAAASLQKMLTLEGHVAEDVPVEVIGDVLRIRQILTNLISNAIKFTHEGKVEIKLYAVPDPCFGEKSNGKLSIDPSSASEKLLKEAKEQLISQHAGNFANDCEKHGENSRGKSTLGDSTPRHSGVSVSTIGDDEPSNPTETKVWIRCDVRDTGIGIPEKALPSLFKKYMQVSADHARKYGGTGLGLAICKQLLKSSVAIKFSITSLHFPTFFIIPSLEQVELMGGQLTVFSQEHIGSTFTFVLPYKVSIVCDSSDDPDELPDMAEDGPLSDANADNTNSGFFLFQPRTLGSLFSSSASGRTQKVLPNNFGFNALNKIKSESESSSRHGGDTDNESKDCQVKQCQDDANDHLQVFTSSSTHNKKTNSQVPDVMMMDEPQEKCQKMEFSHRSSECGSTSTPEEQKSKLLPKILLVEDNKINVMVTRSMMKQLGHSIDVVNNGVEAVRAVQCSHYDLILMDVCMPVMDGLQATRLIRSFEETGNWDAAEKAGIEQPQSSLNVTSKYEDSSPPKRRIPIIAMTANALSESADECFANGMDSFVSKPVTFQNLKQCLQQHLS